MPTKATQSEPINITLPFDKERRYSSGLTVSGWIDTLHVCLLRANLLHLSPSLGKLSKEQHLSYGVIYQNTNGWQSEQLRRFCNIHISAVIISGADMPPHVKEKLQFYGGPKVQNNIRRNKKTKKKISPNKYLLRTKANDVS